LNEEKFDYEKMIDDTVNNVQTIIIREEQEDNFSNLL
jgi:hypothetical protein